MREKIDALRNNYRSSFLRWFHEHQAIVQPLFVEDKGSGAVEDYIDDFGVEVIDGLYLDLCTMAADDGITLPRWEGYEG